MDLNNVSSIVALLAALSVASERLVEIVKGLIPVLNKENPNPDGEGRRQVILHVLAVIAGIVTAWLASTTTTVKLVIPDTPLAWIVVGLLASGGSGFWNSIQGYVNKAKDVKKAEAERKKIETEAKKAAIALPPPR
jgi:hypothetical protein